MKKFVCEETGERITIFNSLENASCNYDRIKNMSKQDLKNILNWANEKTLRDAMQQIAEENKERLLKLAQIIHGRIYEKIRNNVY